MPRDAEQQDAAQLKSLGERLRSLRSARGWTLEELSERSGVSKPFLSRLEGGSRQPSIAVVLTLARVFSVPVSTLFETSQEDTGPVVVRSGEAAVQRGNGISFSPLSGAARFNLQAMRAQISPLRRGDERYQHDGEEWLYVISGRLRLRVGESQYDLDTGDAAHFDSRLPHRIDALDGKEASIVLVACAIPVTLNARREMAAKAGLLG